MLKTFLEIYFKFVATIGIPMALVLLGVLLKCAYDDAKYYNRMDIGDLIWWIDNNWERYNEMKRFYAIFSKIPFIRGTL